MKWFLGGAISSTVTYLPWDNSEVEPELWTTTDELVHWAHPCWEEVDGTWVGEETQLVTWGLNGSSPSAKASATNCKYFFSSRLYHTWSDSWVVPIDISYNWILCRSVFLNGPGSYWPIDLMSWSPFPQTSSILHMRLQLRVYYETRIIFYMKRDRLSANLTENGAPETGWLQEHPASKLIPS